jgi:ankyrin repeat protein
MDERARGSGPVVWRLLRAAADWCVVAGIACLAVGGALAYQRGAVGDGTGEPALQEAAQRGDVARVARLLGRGADVNGADDDGRTALTAAARSGRLDVARLLLSRGADVNKAEPWGATPLMLAAAQGWGDEVELLLRHGADARARAPGGMDALATAAAGGDARCVRLLLSAGADPNAAGRRCNLLSYLNDERVDLARTLLAAGLDPDVPDEDGSLPIDTLRAQHQPACVAEIERARQARLAAATTGRKSSTPSEVSP